MKLIIYIVLITWKYHLSLQSQFPTQDCESKTPYIMLTCRFINKCHSFFIFIWNLVFHTAVNRKLLLGDQLKKHGKLTDSLHENVSIARKNCFRLVAALLLLPLSCICLCSNVCGFTKCNVVVDSVRGRFNQYLTAWHIGLQNLILAL